ncbi:MAG: hypothetical protein JJU24_19425 [Natronohydrobacter sp.]|nr:hypothetical protein [Natronohydrobacter sp.]
MRQSLITAYRLFVPDWLKKLPSHRTKARITGLLFRLTGHPDFGFRHARHLKSIGREADAIRLYANIKQEILAQNFSRRKEFELARHLTSKQAAIIDDPLFDCSVTKARQPTAPAQMLTGLLQDCTGAQMDAQRPTPPDLSRFQIRRRQKPGRDSDQILRFDVIGTAHFDAAFGARGLALRGSFIWPGNLEEDILPDEVILLLDNHVLHRKILHVAKRADFSLLIGWDLLARFPRHSRMRIVLSNGTEAQFRNHYAAALTIPHGDGSLIEHLEAGASASGLPNLLQDPLHEPADLHGPGIPEGCEITPLTQKVSFDCRFGKRGLSIYGRMKMVPRTIDEAFLPQEAIFVLEDRILYRAPLVPLAGQADFSLLIGWDLLARFPQEARLGARLSDGHTATIQGHGAAILTIPHGDGSLLADLPPGPEAAGLSEPPADTTPPPEEAIRTACRVSLQEPLDSQAARWLQSYIDGKTTPEAPAPVRPLHIRHISVTPANPARVQVRTTPPGRFHAEFGYLGLKITAVLKAPRDLPSDRLPQALEIRLDDHVLRPERLNFVRGKATIRFTVKRQTLEMFPPEALLSLRSSQGGYLTCGKTTHLRLTVPHGDGSIFANLESAGPLSKKGWPRLSPEAMHEKQNRYLDLYTRARTAFMEEFNKPLFVLYGTLLGQHRGGDFIPGDDDFDVGYVSEQTTPEAVKAEAIEIMERLVKRGMIVLLNREGKPHRLRDAQSGVEIHLDNRPVFTMNDGHVWLHKLARLDMDLDEFRNVETARLRETEIFKPRGTEAFLAAYYGPNWRVPDPGFSNASKVVTPEITQTLSAICLSLEEQRKLKARLDGRYLRGEFIPIGLQKLYPLEEYAAKVGL